MATTRYVVAATATRPVKIVSTAKAARNEADARAEVELVNVEVRTQSTDKLIYTAQGAPVAEPVETPAAAEPVTVEAPADETPAAEPAAAEPVTVEAPADETPAAEPVTPDATPAAEDGDEEAAPVDLEEMIREVKAEAKDPQRKAACGCLVELILSTGGHGKDCADAPVQAAAAVAVRRDPAPKAPRAPRTGGGTTGRRAALGEAVVPGWELLYDKPGQKAQVGRRAGKYALICTDHKTVRELTKLVEERTLRSAGGWCASCTH